MEEFLKVQQPTCMQVYLKTNCTNIPITTSKKNNVDFEREGAA
jgi:hypothetical protein